LVIIYITVPTDSVPFLFFLEKRSHFVLSLFLGDGYELKAEECGAVLG
jgi:hypothetical protein